MRLRALGVTASRGDSAEHAVAVGDDDPLLLLRDAEPRRLGRLLVLAEPLIRARPQRGHVGQLPGGHAPGLGKDLRVKAQC